MKTKIKGCGILHYLMAIVSAIILLSAFPIGVSATKAHKSYDIAVVFDNSGSMYMGNNDKAWCRATYAMEIFASMLDYENGDKLTIYPMWEVTTDGSTPSPGNVARECNTPIIVQSKSDIDKISNLFTICASGTPFTPVEKAYEALKSSTASQRWLIVLTDGQFSGINGEGVRERFMDIAKSGINIQYLGLGDEASIKDLKEDKNKGLYYKLSYGDGTGLMTDLVDICNAIFQRTILPDDYYYNNTLNLDLSMKKVIVFVQGQGAKIDSLKTASGETISPIQTSGQRKFSEFGCGRHSQGTTFGIDNTLYGEVVTFANCPKGQYFLECVGAEKVQIFYEPDVDIKVSLVNSDGIAIDASAGGIDADKYTISSKFVDSVTGEDVTNHVLMGNDVSFVTYVKASGESSATPYKDGATIEFKPDDQTEVVVEGTYLKDYTITTKGDPNAFPLPLIVRNKTYDLKAWFSGQTADYKVMDYLQWQALRADLSIDGRPLTSDEMSRTQFVSNGDVSFYAEALPNESAYVIYIGKDENNQAKVPQIGQHESELRFIYSDERGNQFECGSKLLFNVMCDFDVTAVVEQSQNWYKTGDHEKWKPIKLIVSVDGKPLTEEQLSKVTPSINFEKDISYRCETVPSESAFFVYIGNDQNGSYVEPSTGKYKMQVAATFADEYGNSFTDDADASFEVQKYSKFWVWLFWILILLALLILIMTFLNHPTLPTSIYFYVKRSCQPIKINGNKLALSSDLYRGEIGCTAKACSPFKDRGKPTSAFEVVSIKPLGSVNWYELDGLRYKKENGKYVDSEGHTIDEAKPKVRITDETELKWNTNRHTVTGKIYINHNE